MVCAYCIIIITIIIIIINDNKIYSYLLSVLRSVFDRYERQRDSYQATLSLCLRYPYIYIYIYIYIYNGLYIYVLYIWTIYIWTIYNGLRENL